MLFATGGVMQPMTFVMVTIMPRCSRSMPTACAIGMNSGSSMETVAMPSRKKPKISRITVMMSRIG